MPKSAAADFGTPLPTQIASCGPVEGRLSCKREGEEILGLGGQISRELIAVKAVSRY